MKPSIKDVDFSFEEAAKDRERERLRNPYRSTIASHDPATKPRKAPWKVTEGARVESAWTVERPAGKPATFTENRRPAHVSILDPKTGDSNLSFFKLRIVERCGLASQGAEIGDLVNCFACTAYDLIAGGRVEVLEEIRHGK